MRNRTSTAFSRRKKLREARTRLAGGNLSDAERLSLEILAEDNDNPEVISLLATVAYQRGNKKLANKLWRGMLERNIPPWLFLHTLHNLVQALVTEGGIAEARQVTTQYRIPDWPRKRTLDEKERDALLNLVDSLVELGQRDAAYRLLISLTVVRPEDARLLFVLGHLQMGKGDLESAWQSFSMADAALQPALNFSLLVSLMECATMRKDTDAENAVIHRVAAASPVLICTAQPEHRATLLVLGNIPNLNRDVKSESVLHFSSNFPAQLAKAFRDEFRFAAIFAGDPAGRAARTNLPTPDLVINNCTNAEVLVAEGQQAEVTEFADSFAVPVVNHPDKVPFSAREKSAELLAGIPGLVVPAIQRFTRCNRPVLDAAEEIEAAFPYPLVTRMLRTQHGIGMRRIENREALIKALEASPEEALLASPFIDSRKASGLYRKIRAAVVNGEIFVIRVDHDHYWKIHGRKKEARADFYRKNPHLLALEDRICRDPHGELGETAILALRAISERIPLDIFGIDFDVAPDGRVVFYEANATMNLLSTAAGPDVDYPRYAEERMLAAIRSYLLDLL